MSQFALNTALGALQAARTGIEVTSHNVANVNNDDFTRQGVEQASRISVSRGGLPVGTGVDVTDVVRTREAFLDDRLRAISSDASVAEARADLLSSAEELLLEPDSGLTQAFDGLWSSVARLADDPDDVAVRAEVIGELDEIASVGQTIGEGWQELGEAAGQQLSGYVDEINQAAREVADLNGRMASGRAVTDNDLADQRDAAADRLAELAGADVRMDEEGQLRVSVAGMGIVAGAQASELTLTGTTVEHPTGVAVDIGGTAGGVQTVLAEDLPSVQGEFETAVGDIIDVLNNQHAAGRAPDGSAGGDLLSMTGGLRTLTNEATPDGLAAAGPGAGTPDRFDAANAEELADLRTEAVIGGLTADEQLREAVSGLAGRAQRALASSDSAEQQMSGASLARSNAHGVNLDEEMTQLLSFQRAYEAAGRVLTAADEMLDTLINRTGVVGR